MSDSIEVVVGRVGKPHGIKGELTIDVRTDAPDTRFAIGARLRAEPPRGSASPLTEVTVKSARWHQGRLLLGFEEVADRNAAEAARGLVLHTTKPADETPDDPDEFYDHQLVGVAVYDEDGTRLGEVTHLVHGGAQDLLGIRTPDRRDTLVPFVKQLVPTVDLAADRIVVRDRPGLVSPLEDEQ